MLQLSPCYEGITKFKRDKNYSGVTLFSSDSANMASVDGEDAEVSSVESTVEDTYESLKNLKEMKSNDVEGLITIMRNNEVRTLSPDVTPEEIRNKRLKFIKSMEKFVAQEQPKDLPVPESNNFYGNAIQELENEVYTMEKLNELAEEEIAEIETDIQYMEKKKIALEQVKEAAMTKAEAEEITDYEKEMLVTKCLFQDTKEDLKIVVDTLFPENSDFQELLTVLTRAFSKGGDDLYIDVDENYLDFVNFLEEADIVQFHPNDRRKIKLRDL